MLALFDVCDVCMLVLCAGFKLFAQISFLSKFLCCIVEGSALLLLFSFSFRSTTWVAPRGDILMLFILLVV